MDEIAAEEVSTNQKFYGQLLSLSSFFCLAGLGLLAGKKPPDNTENLSSVALGRKEHLSFCIVLGAHFPAFLINLVPCHNTNADPGPFSHSMFQTCGNRIFI